MIRTILKYGAEELERKCDPVEDFDQDLRNLAQDMFETMYAEPGIGLAAPQIGINLQLLVIDITAGDEDGNQLVLVNPVIVETQGHQKGEEGCLSIPGFTANVVRPFRVRVEAQVLDGSSIEVEGEDLLARALCHEIDHLQGVLYLDHLSAFRRDMIKRKIRKLVRLGEW